jgi:hypothetical protein
LDLYIRGSASTSNPKIFPSFGDKDPIRNSKAFSWIQAARPAGLLLESLPFGERSIVWVNVNVFIKNSDLIRKLAPRQKIILAEFILTDDPTRFAHSN